MHIYAHFFIFMQIFHFFFHQIFHFFFSFQNPPPTPQNELFINYRLIWLIYMVLISSDLLVECLRQVLHPVAGRVEHVEGEHGA